MTEVQTALNPDTSDMIAVHKVFRHALTSASRLIEGTPPGDLQRAAVVGSYYDNILRFLKVHHQAEDDLIWPKLAQRAPARSELVQEMTSDHERIHDPLDLTATALPLWTSSPDPAAGQALISGLEALGRVLTPHLDREEQEVVPLCSEYLTLEEWGQMPGHALASYDGDKVWLILGLIRENMTQQQCDDMLAHMPPPARDMWVNMGNAAFDEFIGEVRAGLSG